MAVIRVGVGEYAVSSNQEDILKTYALGSCVAVLVYDFHKGVAGMIHIALPDSKVNEERALRQPAYFADSGLVKLLRDMKRKGATRKTSWIKLIGGAKISDPNSLFDIGKRNVLAVKKILWRYKLAIKAEDTGGDYSRTVTLAVDDGSLMIRTGGVKGNAWTI